MDFLLDYSNHFEFKVGETPFSTWHWPIGASVAYLLMVFFGVRLMKLVKKPIKLPQFAIVHNLFLCLLSVAMVCGALYEAYLLWDSNGRQLSEIICDPRGITLNGRLNFWMYIFYLSKFYEFIDTFLIILSKRTPIVLHWYHHFITLILVWIGMSTGTALQWLGIVTNGGVHIFMYFYYMISAMGFNPWWKRYVTSIQIVQFVIDLIIPQLYVWYFYVDGIQCSGDMKAFYFGELVIVSFLLLFVNFYKTSYDKSKSSKKSSTTGTKKDE